MCPDKSILSAFYDGEVEGSWHGKIAMHHDECSLCRKETEQFKSISRSLNNESLPDFLAGKDRMFLEIINKARFRSLGSKNIWHRHVSLPAPMVAAAAAMFIFLFGWSAYNSGLMNAASPEQDLVELKENQTTIIVNAYNLQDLEHLLESDDFKPASYMSLPDSQTFKIFGDSQLIKSVSFEELSSQ